MDPMTEQIQKWGFRTVEEVEWLGGHVLRATLDDGSAVEADFSDAVKDWLPEIADPEDFAEVEVIDEGLGIGWPGGLGIHWTHLTRRADSDG